MDDGKKKTHRSVPADPSPPWFFHTRQDPRLPETELQALMEAEPNHAPRTTQDQLQRVDQQVVDAVNILSEDERNVIEVAVMSGHSIRDTARILGMPASTVQRLKQKALTKLREEIQ